MSGNDKKNTPKTKKNGKTTNVLSILHISFGVIAAISLIVTLLLSPIGDKLIKKDSSEKAESTTVAQTSDADETEIRFGLYYSPTLDAFYWPEPTEPTVDTLTNYNLIVNTVNFNYKRDAGVTTVYAKEDISATMTVTPLPSVEYTSLTETVSAEYGNPISGKALPGVEISCCYSTESDGYATVIYCVDDLKGGSIEIRYSYSTTYENSYESRFEMMLTTFETK